MAKNITNIKAVSGKAKIHDVQPLPNGAYKVTSGHSGQAYYVRLNPPACTCKWANYQPKGSPVACSHVQAAKAYQASKSGYTAKFRAIGDKIDHLHRRHETLGNGVKLTLRKV